MPLVTEVHLKLEEVPDPVTAVTTNVSLGGMSVAVERTAEVGSLAAFELEVGGALVEGTGEVAWVRGESAGPDVETGMGIRFRYLSPGSRERIFRLVQWYSNQSGSPSPQEVAAAASGLTPPPGGVRNPAPPRAAPSPSGPATPATEPVVLPEPMDPAPAPKAPQSPAPASTAPEPEPRLSPEWELEEDLDFDLPGPAAVAPQPAVVVDEDDDIPPLPPGYGGAPASEAAWVRPEPERLVLPSAPEDPAVSPADLAQVPFARAASPQGMRGVGYARRRRGGVWMWIAVLLLLALGMFAAVRWWMVAQQMGLVPGRDERPASAASLAGTAPATTARPTLGSSVPRREDAERLPAATATSAGEDAVPAEAAQPLAEPEPPPSDALPEPDTGAPAALEPAVPAAPAPAAPAAPLAAAASAVQSIRWEAGSGSTTVVIQADGEVPRASLVASPLSGGSPRLLLRIRGIGRQYPQARLAVGTPELTSIRTGLHATDLGSELHVVLDLGSARVVLTGLETTGGTIRAVLSHTT